MGAVKRRCPDEFDQSSKPARKIREDLPPLRRSPRIYGQKNQHSKARTDAPVKRRRAPVATFPKEYEEVSAQLLHHKSSAEDTEGSHYTKTGNSASRHHHIGCQSDGVDEEVIVNPSSKGAVGEDIKQTISSATGPHVLDGQRAYRCPNCSFPCWLCNTAEISDKPRLEIEEQNDLDLMSTPITSATSSKRRRNDGLIYLGPKDKQFEEYILASAAVEILDGIYRSEPEDIWKDAVRGDRRSRCQVFLEVDREKADEIATQVVHSHQRKYDETALTKIVTKYLASFDPYVARNGPEALVSLRRDKWKPGKQGPPFAKRLSYTYDWDVGAGYELHGRCESPIN